jgi:hypothetical protein
MPAKTGVLNRGRVAMAIFAKCVVIGTARFAASVVGAPKKSGGDVGRSRLEYLNIDSAVVRAPRHAAGPKRGPEIKPFVVRVAA